MRIVSFDFEVTKDDWLLCAKDVKSGEETVIHNNPSALREFLQRDQIIAGFNNKHYDNGILKTIWGGGTNSDVKAVNDWIISGEKHWEHPLTRRSYVKFSSIDVKDDMYIGHSLKEIAGHLGLNIVESSVPFDIDRPLTQGELDEMIYYCKSDVDVNIAILKSRKNYLKTKINLALDGNLNPIRALGQTNARLTADYLRTQPVSYNDERDYEMPPEVDTDRIPGEVLDFFSLMYDRSISDDELFKQSHTITLGGVDIKYGFGGVHGSPNNYHERSENGRVIYNYDVASLYPSLMIEYGFLSRAILNPEDFKRTYDRRMEAKRTGDKTLSDALKLILNTAYGTTLAKFNPMYDPKMGRSVCITGQLLVTMLYTRYLEEVGDVKLIDVNTDGVMISFPEDQLETVERINREWEKRTRLVLEGEMVDWIYKSDVNNYIASIEGDLKTKGGYFQIGIKEFGSSWSVNNNYNAVKRAMINKLAYDTPIEDTIRSTTDILDFQQIAKAGSKYESCEQFVANEPFDPHPRKNDRTWLEGELIPQQKVNRVYASKDSRLGTLYKVHKETGRPAKISDLPYHCVIDNDNRLTI